MTPHREAVEAAARVLALADKEMWYGLPSDTQDAYCRLVEEVRATYNHTPTGTKEHSDEIQRDFDRAFLNGPTEAVEGDRLLSLLPDVPNGRWSVTNLGGGWRAVLSMQTEFRGDDPEAVIAAYNRTRAEREDGRLMSDKADPRPVGAGKDAGHDARVASNVQSTSGTGADHENAEADSSPALHHEAGADQMPALDHTRAEQCEDCGGTGIGGYDDVPGTATPLPHSCGICQGTGRTRAERGGEAGEREIWLDEAVMTDQPRGFVASEKSHPILNRPVAYVPKARLERLQERLVACEPRGECPVCGGETDHVDTCEVGILERRLTRTERGGAASDDMLRLYREAERRGQVFCDFVDSVLSNHTPTEQPARRQGRTGGRGGFVEI